MLTGENFLAGVVMGVAAGIQPGPLAALVVREASRHGFAAGARVALAPLLSDGPIVLLAIGAQRYFLGARWPFTILSLCAAAYCLWLARLTMQLDFNVRPEASSRNGSLRQAVVINLLNPQPYIFWLTVGVTYISKDGWRAGAAFVLAFLLAIVGAKTVLAWLVAGARRRYSPQHSTWMGRCLALALAVFALRLFRDALMQW